MVNKNVCTSGRLLSMDLYFPLAGPLEPSQGQVLPAGQHWLWVLGPLGGKLETDCVGLGRVTPSAGSRPGLC